jgi:hypothetical protein
MIGRQQRKPQFKVLSQLPQDTTPLLLDALQRIVQEIEKELNRLSAAVEQLRQDVDNS